MPRGDVLRCHILGNADGETIIQIDDFELDMDAFARMLRVFEGFGMRVAFVDPDEVTDEPAIVVRDPDNETAER